MKKNKFSIIALSILIITSMMLSGCDFINNVEVKLNLKNQKFDYIKQNRVDKIVIQSVRDSGFRFIVNDSKAIDDIYDILSDGSEVSKKSSLAPDYIFEIYTGDEVKKYQYVVGANEKGTGNFYDENDAFSVPKNLENTIMENLSFIRKPRDFNYIYYQSILKVIETKKDALADGSKVGIDIQGDTDCLKYVFSTDLEEFKKNLNAELPNSDLVDKNPEDFDVIVKVKNRGFNTTLFKTLITIDNKKDKSSENYYVIAEYNYNKDWDIKVSEPGKVPQDW
ncbi:hypothetical protein CDLVIII_0302 [Clostridium sp. DL-VIII]|uniref:hypothetical protein n=1 Tax=Clostridium sp. DL-VIII TaxID=641107 RepID=UPI00023AF182|nr:hypothetical protein [Clostridium sp. DL-VIII]EHI97039.1 hypothetical protein CDLVIII_0302 [Clostridium sp. DL-VIII]